MCLLRCGVDILQGVGHGKLPVPQSVPVGEDVVVLKHLLVVAHRVVELDEATVVVLQATVALAKQLLPCTMTFCFALRIIILGPTQGVAHHTKLMFVP